MGIIYCSKCSATSDVADSRPTLDGLIRRRRQCTQCNRRWTTLEVPKDAWQVIMELLGPNSKLVNMADDLERIANRLRELRIEEDDSGEI
jgi:transcriptional regulator NrdR family protein